MVDFGKRLRLLRQAKGLTQEQLARSLGLTKSVISAYETDMRMPSYDVLIRLSSIFNVTTDYMLGLHHSKTVDITSLTDTDASFVVALVDRLSLSKTDDTMRITYD